MHCFDTNLVISFFRGDKEATLKVGDVQRIGGGAAITNPTLCELYKGAFLSAKTEEGLAYINRFLEGVSLLDMSKMSCLLFGQDYAFLQKRGMQTQEMDLMIASICKANNVVLVTRNVKDFRNIPNLLVEKW